ALAEVVEVAVAGLDVAEVVVPSLIGTKRSRASAGNRSSTEFVARMYSCDGTWFFSSRKAMFTSAPTRSTVPRTVTVEYVPCCATNFRVKLGTLRHALHGHVVAATIARTRRWNERNASSRQGMT